MNNTSKNVVVLLCVLVAICALIFVPLVSIWSINTIFSLNIAYTISTWFAAMWVSAVTIAPRYYKGK